MAQAGASDVLLGTVEIPPLPGSSTQQLSQGPGSGGDRLSAQLWGHLSLQMVPHHNMISVSSWEPLGVSRPW